MQWFLTLIRVRDMARSNLTAHPITARIPRDEYADLLRAAEELERLRWRIVRLAKAARENGTGGSALEQLAYEVSFAAGPELSAAALEVVA